MNKKDNKHYGCIYKATNILNGKCYIGQTVQPFKAYIRNHISSALRNKDKDNRYFYCAIRKDGGKNFEWEILRFCNSMDELNKYEKEYIFYFRSYDKTYGYNLTFGGNVGIPTMATRKKMSNRKIGRKISEEVKLKMSNSHKGKSKTVEHIRKVAESHTLHDLDHEINNIVCLKRKGYSTRQIAEMYNCYDLKISRLLERNIPKVVLLEIEKENKANRSEVRKKYPDEARKKISESKKGIKSYQYRKDIDEKRDEILKMRMGGISILKISKMHKCSRNVVYRILGESHENKII